MFPEGGKLHAAVLWRLLVALLAIGAIVGSRALPSAYASGESCGSDVWNGAAGDGSWADAGNWSSGEVPQTCDNVAIGPTQGGVTSVSNVAGISLTSFDLNDVALVNGGAVTVTGEFSWSNDTSDDSYVGVAITVDGSTTFSGSGDKDIFTTSFTLDGSTSVEGTGPIGLSNNALLDNNGTLTMADGSQIGDGGGGPTHVVTNTGTIDVPSGTATMDLYDAKFTQKGTVSIAPKATLSVQSGVMDLYPTSVISGGGTLDVDSSGVAKLATGTTIGAGSTIELGDSGWFKGTGSFRGSGAFQWTGGIMEGDLTVAHTISTTIGGSTGESLFDDGQRGSGTLTLDGPTSVLGTGPLELANACNLVNVGTLTMASGAQIGNGGGGATHLFTNTGTIVVPVGTATLSLYDAKFKAKGTVSTASGAELSVQQGVSDLYSTSIFEGGGTVAVGDGATLKLATGSTIGTGTDLELGPDSGFIKGTGSFVGSGTFEWTAGVMEGNLTVASPVTTNISGAVSQSGDLTLQGTTNFTSSGDLELANGSLLANTGSMTLLSGSKVAIGGGGAPETFTNSGSVQITGASFSVDNYMQTAGSTSLAGGTLTTSNEMQLTGGALDGTGTINGSVDNAATVDPATDAALQITGDYKQEATGALDIELNGAAVGEFGQLTITGAAQLDGTLAISEGDGYSPPHGQTFKVVTYGSEAGQFSTLDGSPAYTVTYGTSADKVVFS